MMNMVKKLACGVVCAAVALGALAEYKCELSFPSASSTELENFPVLVRISPAALDGFSYAECPTASCLWFTDRNDETLPFDVDTWDTTGESLVWVSVPSLSTTATITMHCSANSVEAPVSPDSTNVWSRAGYYAVWHMNEILEDGEGKHYTPDASGKGWHAYKQDEDDANYPVPTNNAPTVTAHPTPLTGTAMNIACGAGKASYEKGGFLVPAGVTSSTTLNGPGFVFSAIVNARQTASNSRIITTGTTYSEMANISVGSDDIYCMGGNSYHNKANPAGSTGWVCAAAVFGRGSTKKSFIFADGVNLTGSAGGNPANYASHTPTKGIGLGCFTDGSYSLNGYIDEARIRNVASSDEWVAAEYATLQPGFVVPMAQPSSLSRGCTIAATNLAAGVVLTNFPLMVKLTASNKYGFAYADAAVDGSDVRFFDADDMQLFHEVASWNQAGESVLYVSVPRLSRDTVVTMRWHKKNPLSVLPPMPASAVWTAAGYKFVWHLDRYDSTIGGYANSVSTNYPAKPVGTAPTVVAGAQGSAAGIYGDYPLLAQGAGYVFSQPFSVSCWSRYPASRWDCASGSGRIWTCGTNNQAANIFFNWKQGFVMGDTNNSDLAKYLSFQKPASGDTDEQTKAKSRCKKDTWQFVTGVYQSTSSKTYLDGVLIPQDSSDYHQLDTLSTSRTVFGLGGFTNAQPGDTGNFQGEIDEIRIRSGVASADWVKAEYDNATDAGFLKISRLPVSGFAVHLL